jgi:hypothetical protein
MRLVFTGMFLLMMDLQSLLHYTSPIFTWKDCSTLQVAYRKISELSLATVVGQQKATVLVDATLLEQTEFALSLAGYI